MEFLKEYWPLLVCVVLIIIAVVVLFVFRDKPEDKQGTTDVTVDAKTDEQKPALETEKTEEQTEQKEQKQTEEKTSEQPKQEKPKKARKTKKVEKEETLTETETAEKPVEEAKAEEPVEEAKVEEPTAEKQEEVKEPEQTTSEEEMEDKKPAQKYMVTYDKEHKDWVVKKTGAARASKRCKTKKEAMEVAEKLAETQELNISVKKKDGKFQKRENASK